MNPDDPGLRDLYNDNQAYKSNQEYYDHEFNWQRIFNIALPVTIFVASIVYTILYSFDYNLLSPLELLWNCLVYVVPSRLLNLVDPTDPSLSSIPRTHAAKSATMRRLLGLDAPGGLIGAVTQVSRRRLSSIPGINMATPGMEGRPAGLGNWDNSCYQNSVLQGLASLDTFPEYLVDPIVRSPEEELAKPEMKMADSLRGLIENLKNPSNNGKRIWTPATLKSMSSWQQQDAQEYFSKVLDEIDKEILSAACTTNGTRGFEVDQVSDEGLKVTSRNRVEARPKLSQVRNPLEGLLAQRVGCTRCGYSEGLSMIPFNCLTVPLGRDWTYHLSDCLDEYTKLEGIEGVECGKCTLLKSQRLLNIISDRLKDAPEDDHVRKTTTERLAAVNEALENDDYEDKTLMQKCKIPPKSRVTTTKSRQAVIARPPRSLAVHVNRSLFDEMTGDLRKNTAEVRFPKLLDLGSWCLGSSRTKNDAHYEEWLLDPGESMISGSHIESRVQGPIYELRAVVTHYGRHENGHYVCYRRHPVPLVDDDDQKAIVQEQWWRLSDDDVTKVNENTIRNQGGVFMLFYDQVETAKTKTPQLQESSLSDDVVAAMNVPLPADNEEDLLLHDSDQSSSVAMSRDESASSTALSEADHEQDTEYQPAKPIVIPPFIQSSGGRAQGGNAKIRSSSMVMV